MKLRLRTKFLLSMVLITTGLTAVTLLLVRRSVEGQVKREIAASLQNSAESFQNFQRGREIALTHSADLLADLPILRAVMTTRHEATIQDVSEGLWKLAGSDLFVLADPSGRVVGIHAASPGFTRDMAQRALGNSLAREGHWWHGGGHLYQVFIRPIYFGPAAANHLLGFLAIGFEVDDNVVSQVARIAASQVAFYYGDNIVRSTLTRSQEQGLAASLAARGTPGVPRPLEVQLADERFLATTLDLTPGATPSVRLTVLKSFDEATAFLNSLNRLLLALGLAGIAVGSGLVFAISHTFTRPLGQLVGGVRALGRGDFDYPLDARGGDEVAEVTASFRGMRSSLLQTQERLLEAERLATLGRMSSSISHDLRHSLAAIVANAEFLCESRLSANQREELYQEICIGVNQMTDLIDSLLEFSRTAESLRPVYSKVGDTVSRAIQAVRTHHEFDLVQIFTGEDGHSEGWYDARRLERVLANLLLNACEAVPAQGGRIQIAIREMPGGAEIKVSDNGRGIPKEVREQLFDPFVSYGKENGTGLGLAVVQKIMEDHGGCVAVESTSQQGTVFRLWLPLPVPSESRTEAQEHVVPPPVGGS